MQTITVTNIGHDSARFRVGRMDDAGKFYSRRSRIMQTGQVAVGMGVKVEIEITTGVSSEGTLDDVLEVLSEHGTIAIPMTGQVVPPAAHDAALVVRRVQLIAQ